MLADHECDVLLRRVSADAAESLFEAYGVTLRRCDALALPEHTLFMCSIVGFTGPSLRGTVVLATNEAPIEGSKPVPGSANRDWIAELANQLVGRMKNRLLAHGADIYVTTPVVLRGEHLAPLPRSRMLPESFVADGDGVVCVWTEVEVLDGFELSEQTDGTRVSAAEGEALMF